MSNIFTNDFSIPISTGLIATPISDHLPIFAVFNRKKQYHKYTPQFITKRDMSSQNKERFREWVKKWGTDFCLRSHSVQEDANLFIEQLKDGYETCFPSS